MRAESSGGDEFGKSCGIIASNPRVRNACASTEMVIGSVFKLFESGIEQLEAMLEFGALVVGVVSDFDWSCSFERGTVGAFEWALE